jgi:peptidoglycan/LPS O-acetylase OafA/YrhL
VILVHSQGVVAPRSGWLQLLMASGARGVQLFYIASALTLCHSWSVRSGRESSPIRNFYLRRVFRIAPMFYLAIAAYLLIDGRAPRYYAPNGIRWYYVPLTAVFLNGFHPETLTSVVPGGWSIVVEMTFYLVFPFLVTRFRSPARLTLLFAASIVAASVAARVAYLVFGSRYPSSQIYLVDALASLNFFSQFPVFVLGMTAYWLFTNDAWWKTGIAVGAAALVAWSAAWLAFNHAPASFLLSRHVEMGALFALFALVLARYPIALLVNALTRWIGKLSFSMYLTHFAVLDALTALRISQRFPPGDVGALLHYVATVGAAAAVSWLAYRFVERPAIAAGARFIDRFSMKAS